MSMTSSQRYPQQSDKVKCTFKIMNVKVSHFPMIKCSVLSNDPLTIPYESLNV